MTHMVLCEGRENTVERKERIAGLDPAVAQLSHDKKVCT